jgi:hypothetical protein
MNLILQPLFYLLGLGVILLIVLALLSPLEALRWWAGWNKRGSKAAIPVGASPVKPQPADLFIVYFTAIGGISASDISGRERRFLSRLDRAYQGKAVIIDDVFPFSVNNNPLNGERQLNWLWQRIHNSRMGGKGSAFAALIFVRNLLQVAVSSDPRYGPIYNVGVARETARSLIREGYPLGSGTPIVVIGWSGGGQIAVGVVPYLHQAFQAPIHVISVGGVMSDDPGLAIVDHLTHLQGSKDKFPTVGKILYPGRWPISRTSAWNQAQLKGKITTIDPGPMRHTGRGDYFDQRSTLPEGQTYLDKTVAVTVEALAEINKKAAA